MQVWVDWEITHLDGISEKGRCPAWWKCDDFTCDTSYWMASLGPFHAGDRTEYTISGKFKERSVCPERFTFMVEGSAGVTQYRGQTHPIWKER